MKSELMILSGARQGERLEIEGSHIQVGTDADCHVRFSPRKHAGIAAKRAELVADRDGWRIYNQGIGDWYVNQRAVHPQAVEWLRSGDIVRLSEFGPDFRFTIIVEEQPPEPLAPATPPPLPEQAGSSKQEPESVADASHSGQAVVIVPLVVIALIGFIATVAIVLAIKS